MNDAFPLPDLHQPVLAPLWRAAAMGEFRLPRCRRCGAFDWYPSGVCPAGCNGQIEWTRLSGEGRLFSCVLVRRALHAPVAPLGPYLSAIIAIAEDPQTRFVTRLIDVDQAEVRPDMPVVARFTDLGHPTVRTGVIAPLFTRRV